MANQLKGISFTLRRTREATDTITVRLTAARVKEFEDYVQIGRASGIDVRGTIADLVDKAIDEIGEQLRTAEAGLNGNRAV